MVIHRAPIVMLEFVGLGLYDERSISQRGAEAVARADLVYLEAYTSVLAGASFDDLKRYHGRELTVLDRDAIEQQPEPILEAAATEHVVLLVGGDPMVATTHVDLRLRAMERGIPTRVIHGTSIASAAASLCGLQGRRFGKATTVPRPGQFGDHGVPPSVIETIQENQDRGLHTLVYLDIDLSEIDGEWSTETLRMSCLDAGTAAEQLAETIPDMLAVVIARAGSDEPHIKGDTLDELARKEFGPPLHLLIIPGRLHELEAVALKQIAHAPAAAVDVLTASSH